MEIMGAMKMALEALEYVQEAYGNHSKWFKDRVDALRQAIERAEKQEPVAWISEGGDVSRSKRYMDEMGFKSNPLYTAPPKKQWVGLTDEDILLIANRLWEVKIPSDSWLWFARAIEASLKEKNKW